MKNKTTDYVISTGEMSYHRDIAWMHPDGDFPEWAKAEGQTLIKYNGKETTVTVPDGVDEIGADAFRKNKYVETVILPESVYFLGIGSFYSCPALRVIIAMGPIRVWSDYITKKQDVKIVLTKNSLAKADDKFQVHALKGFLYGLEHGIVFDSAVYSENMDWIRRRKKKLYGIAFEEPVLLQRMLDEKMISKKELGDVLAAANAAGNTQAAVMLLEYSSKL